MLGRVRPARPEDADALALVARATFLETYAGIVPAAVEMMDTLAIEAAEEAVHAGYTVGVPAALVVELTGRRGPPPHSRTPSGGSASYPEPRPSTSRGWMP